MAAMDNNAHGLLQEMEIALLSCVQNYIIKVIHAYQQH
jgi:hypothetical protein